jgi:leucyl aminopeptidase
MYLFFFVISFFSFSVGANEVYVTMPLSTQAKLYPHIKMQNSNGLVSFKVPRSELNSISLYNHKNSRFCGGFVVSKNPLNLNKNRSKNLLNLNTYTINRSELVTKLFTQVSEPKLRDFIEYFSSYFTRYYLAKEGVAAMVDLSKRWGKLTSHRSDIEVKLHYHDDWPQPSVILTIKGATDEKIIIGGHGDSINTDDEGVHSPSPGADDNASGISVITEIIRILVLDNYKPKNDITFMAYSAEEVGLLGSMEIAKEYADAGTIVKGVLQIDGVNFNGSEIQIALIDDNTDQKQNLFIGNLIDKYLKVNWGYDTCEYACSDHYSWSYYGFTASYPFESKIAEENPRIHTADDTLAVSGNTADHAVYFAKLGLAYVIELDK